jgi:hypothetical protein
MRIPLPGKIAAALFVVAFYALSAVEANAAIRRVPADYPTIWQAINAAVDSDSVLVASGTYDGGITFLGKAITVISEASPEVTIINGGFRIAGV